MGSVRMVFSESSWLSQGVAQARDVLCCDTYDDTNITRERCHAVECQKEFPVWSLSVAGFARLLVVSRVRAVRTVVRAICESRF